MNQTPMISVIMSVYNGETYLREAIDSVVSQTFPHWELIVINDCSTDSTEKILREYEEKDKRIRVFTNESNLRLPKSLNKALSYAKGIYTARMDADDICLPNRFEEQVAFMESHPEVALSSCRFMTIKNGVVASGGCGGKCDNDSIRAQLLVTNPILHPGIIAKTEIMQKSGYDETLTCTEDLELWTRFAEQGYIMEIQPSYLMIYRLHDKQITSTTAERQHKEVVKIQKKYFDAMLHEMTKEQEAFYIDGIYFTNQPDVKQFCRFFRFLKQENRKKKTVSYDAIAYAMLEILAEYKRKGVSKKDIIYAMLHFSPMFLMKELRARKKRAYRDGVACIRAAESVGYEHSEGTVEFPIFRKSQQ
ncbi:MAG: glycosyltransferase [Clostridia bacterium]|nr:glycosyltransferase [Clostridia bacterium]